MPEIKIVKYQPEYRSMVRDCVYETGYGGESAECYFEDRELLADMITLYYTDYEPESGFIALVDGEPAGYLLGAVDTDRCEEISKKIVLPKILKKMVLGKYKLKKGVRRNIYRTILMLLRGEEVAVSRSEYPAHLHIDLFQEYRRVGVGGRLMDTYIEYLREVGVKGFHLGTSSFHTEALPFYEKRGLTKIGQKKVRTSPFKEISDRDLYNICYAMKLD